MILKTKQEIYWLGKSRPKGYKRHEAKWIVLDPGDNRVDGNRVQVSLAVSAIVEALDSGFTSANLATAGFDPTEVARVKTFRAEKIAERQARIASGTEPKDPLEGMSAEAKKLLLAQKMFDQTKKKAAAEGAVFAITVQDVYDLIPEKCPTLGTPFNIDEELLAMIESERHFS